jgi:hypothetical protein
MDEFNNRLSETLPSPFGRVARSEGIGGGNYKSLIVSYTNRPHPNPLPKGEGTKRYRPRGAVLVVVLVCLGIAMVIFMLLAKQAVAERRTSQTSHQSVQARWLAEAGIERAISKLAADSKYTGETWTIPAAEFAGTDGGMVRIQVKAVAYLPERRAILVEADYPDASEIRCRQSKRIIVDRDAIRSR